MYCDMTRLNVFNTLFPDQIWMCHITKYSMIDGMYKESLPPAILNLTMTLGVRLKTQNVMLLKPPMQTRFGLVTHSSATHGRNA